MDKANSKSRLNQAFGWIHLAEALHHLDRTREAWEILFKVAHKFPANKFLLYELACYACRLGELKQAYQWLAKAIDLDPTGDLRGMALEDADLEALWTEIGQI